MIVGVGMRGHPGSLNLSVQQSLIHFQLCLEEKRNACMLLSLFQSLIYASKGRIHPPSVRTHGSVVCSPH